MVALRHRPKGGAQSGLGLHLVLLLTCCFVSLTTMYLTNLRPAVSADMPRVSQAESMVLGTTAATGAAQNGVASVKGNSNPKLRSNQPSAPKGASGSKQTLGAATRQSAEKSKAPNKTPSSLPLVSDKETVSTVIKTPLPPRSASVQARPFVGINAIRHNMTYDEIWAMFRCTAVFATETRPLYSASMWALLRGVYVGVVGLPASTLNSVHGTAFRKAYVTNQSPGKGRGVFAGEAIQAGELVWVGNSHTARFRSGDDYRRFLALLPSDLVCDMMQFSYVQDLGPATPEDKRDDDAYYDLRICLDLDDGAFMNADWTDDGTFQNVGLVKEPNGEYRGKGQEYYALRNISVGEELLCNYDEFAIVDWEPFGL